MIEKKNERPSWRDLLVSAVHEPGVLHEAYSRFWNYSVGNQVLALLQCRQRGIAPGPIASFQKWQELGRWVHKGQKALSLIMPVTIRERTMNKAEPEISESTESCKETLRRIFVLKRNWFVLAQTEGEEYKPEPIPAWDQEQALQALQISIEPFALLEGNTQGYCSPQRTVAVNPLAVLPHKTLFHEIGHILLGHTEHGPLEDTDKISKELREVEAEAVALICCASLGLPGAEFSRGYIQSWWKFDEIPERSAQRIFAAADKILRAGCRKEEKPDGVHGE